MDEITARPGWQPDGSYILDDGYYWAELWAGFQAAQSEHVAKSKRGRKWGGENPQHKYLSRKWDARRQRWAYTYARPMTKEEMHAVCRDEKTAWELVLESPHMRWHVLTNHTLPAWTAATKHKQTAQLAKGAALLTISALKDQPPNEYESKAYRAGEVVKVEAIGMDDLHGRLALAHMAGYRLRIKNKLGPVPRNEQTPPGGLAQALETAYPHLLDQPTEHALAFSPRNGFAMFQRAGGRSSVRIYDEEAFLLQDTVFVHNHPSGKSLSLGDIELAAHCNMAEMQVVGWRRDGKAALYILSRPAGGWPADFLPARKSGETSNLADEYNHLATTLYPRWMDEVDAGRVSIDEAEDEFRHYIWQNVMAHYGVPYTRRFLVLPGPPAGRYAAEELAEDAQRRGVAFTPRGQPVEWENVEPTFEKPEADDAPVS